MESLFLTIIGSLIILIPCLILELIYTAVKKSQIKDENRKSGDSSNENTKYTKAKAMKGEVIYISKSDYDYL